MTVIAYRGGIMAADSLTTLDEVNLTHTRKIERRHGYLVGIRGESCPSMAECMDWLFTRKAKRLELLKGYIKPFRIWDDRQRDEPPYAFTLLMVSPKGEVFEVDQEGSIEPVPGGHHAIGSGSKYALAVMDLQPPVVTAPVGAIEAVRAGIRRSAHCRAPIYWYSLDGREGVLGA
jgi:ATP-dependent protease HslVU (ClpYQ) peptidase subunit